jgi:hypothetical protein
MLERIEQIVHECASGRVGRINLCRSGAQNRIAEQANAALCHRTI